MTAMELRRLGVTVNHGTTGQPFLSGAKGLAPQIFAEIEARAEKMAAVIPAAGSVPVIRIVEYEPKRWGECMTCGEEMDPHEGGQCFLCIAGLRKALRSAGRLR